MCPLTPPRLATEGRHSDGGHGERRVPPHPRTLLHAPPNNMLIVTSLFKPDTAALLPRQHHTRRPTPATALMPQQHPSSPSNTMAHTLPPSSLPATDSPSPPCQHCSTSATPLPPQQCCCGCAVVALPQPRQLHITPATAVDPLPPGHRDIMLQHEPRKRGSS